MTAVLFFVVVIQYIKIAPYPVKTFLFVILISVAKYIPAAVNDINLFGFSWPYRNTREESFHTLGRKNKHRL